MKSMWLTYEALQKGWPFARTMMRYDFRDKYVGNVFGAAWAIVRPLFQVLAYVFIITFVFRVRIGGEEGQLYTYVLYVISGMMTWQFIVTVFSEAPELIRARMGIIKQVNYPIETLPLMSVAVASIGPTIGLLVFVVLSGIDGTLSWSILLLPVPILLLVLFAVGSCWFLMVMGVIVKDIKEVLGIFFSIGVFASPVFLSQEMLDPNIWSIILLNPFSHIIISMRDVLEGSFHPVSWCIFATITIFALMLGSYNIQQTKKWINEYI